jgi:hypothetical protein
MTNIKDLESERKSVGMTIAEVCTLASTTAPTYRKWRESATLKERKRVRNAIDKYIKLKKL